MKNAKFKIFKRSPRQNKFNSLRLLKNKKGINDISIIAIIATIFLLSSAIIPFINTEFGTTADTFNTDKLESDIKDDAESVSSLSAFNILKTTLRLASFDIGNTLNLPWWLDLIYVILAILFILVIARNIWIGGGA